MTVRRRRWVLTLAGGRTAPTSRGAHGQRGLPPPTPSPLLTVQSEYPTTGTSIDRNGTGGGGVDGTIKREGWGCNLEDFELVGMGTIVQICQGQPCSNGQTTHVKFVLIAGSEPQRYRACLKNCLA